MSRMGQNFRDSTIKGFLDSLTGALLVVKIIILSALCHSTATWAQDYNFSNILVEGNRRIESPTIQSYSGLEASQAVTGAELNSAYQDIVASGLFESVELLPSRSNLVIKVKEFPTINRVAFEGNSKLKDTY